MLEKANVKRASKRAFDAILIGPTRPGRSAIVRLANE
jgi:hypothetical protein